MKPKAIVMVASYGGPYEGNFIPSLMAYNKVVKELGYKSVCVFPAFTENYIWAKKVNSEFDTVYFIDYKPHSLSNIKQLREIFIKENAALVYSRMSGWDISVKFACKSIPVIWHMEMGLKLDSRKKTVKNYIKYHFPGFGKTYNIAVSEPTCNEINKLKPKNKCIYLPNALDFSRLKPSEHNICDSKKKTVNLLTFAYSPIIKGFDIALDACNKLNKEQIKFNLLASAQDNTYKYVKERYGENVPSWLKLTGPTNDISSLYGSVDILLSPSRSEGLSYVNLEGLYCGLPLVYSDIPGNSFAKDFRATYRFDSENPQALAEAILKCEKEYISQEEFIFNQEYIRKNYSIDNWSSRLKNIILDVLSKE